MDWLNYHHLLYFWTIAREGSVSRAAEVLHLAQPTLSSQVRKLETSIGHDLFERSGRSMVLTETGQLVFRYADEIFGLGRQLVDVLRGRTDGDTSRVKVGVQGAIPKLVVYELLRPALEEADRNYQFVCSEGKLGELLAELALHRLDVVIADRPLAADTHVRAFNHLLGKCGVTVYGSSDLYRKYHTSFPQSLHEAPMLLPTQNTALRRLLEQWFDTTGIRPRTAHEFEDSAVLKVFGHTGHGMFVTPSAIEKEVCRQYSVRIVGRIPEVIERFYAISVEKRLKHPAVLAISRSARTGLFAE
jgi:LysR family transcriptional activator of nhaA